MTNKMKRAITAWIISGGIAVGAGLVASESLSSPGVAGVVLLACLVSMTFFSVLTGEWRKP